MSNKKTYAQRAKDLISKYKRASFDKTEEAELSDALAALAEEQEQYKMANGIGEYSPEAIAQRQAEQMEQQMIMQQQGQMAEQPMQTYDQQGQLPQFYDGGDLYRMPLSMGIDPMALKGPSVGKADVSQMIMPAETVVGQTQGILPSVIGGGVSLLGNLGMAMASKPYQYDKQYGTENVSLANEREMLQRQGDVARNIANRNLRTSGNRGSYLAGAGAVSAGIGQQTGDAMSQSMQRESLLNLQQREKANELNRNIDLMNYQARVQADQDKKGYIANAINSATAAGSDINKILGQNAMIESIGSQNYMISPSTSSGKRDLWMGRTIKGKVRPQ